METIATKRRVLIVDDDERIAKALERNLRDVDGLDVQALSSGLVARDALLQARYDLLITDWFMPGVDGMSLVSLVHERSPQTITILMSAYGSPVSPKGERAPLHFLSKPFEIDDLLNIIRSVFPPPLPVPVLLPETLIAPAPAPQIAPPSPPAPPPPPLKQVSLKVILGGDANVGKSSLIHRYCTGRFDPKRAMTIGVDFQVYEVEVEQTHAKLVVWDLGGQERFAPARLGFYRGTRAVGLVFDANNRNSFYNLMRWWREVRQHLRDVPVLLLANKADLGRQVSPAEAKMLATAWGIPHFESSCATGQGVTEFFEALATAAVKFTPRGKLK